ncbi:hypothetical protein HNR46_002542 [Haloferula luteola]|uniref:Uncharacterized protein n=1 Tax=Haloferula luteola TaxID=595692 RepID=A0A840VEP1_9BACT|nr:hypothetical protein [Haloferula luteola]MBB5352299.1 hypothetical protein [Haloferula luteola]
MKVSLQPAIEAAHRMVKEIQHRARVYSLFDVAKLFLNHRGSYVLEVAMEESKSPMFRGKRDASLFLTKEEAVAHFLSSSLFDEIYESEEIECEAPAGNFQVVARCGFSGEWLGPPNFHSYQANLRRLHRERFSNMPFDRYASRVRTERGEEAVNEWLESMKKRTRWRVKGSDEDAWTFDRSEMDRDFSQNRFDEFFQETFKAEVPGDIDAKALSIGILAAVRIAGSHARKHPAMMIPALCRALESDHLAIFKTKGKLFCGPARPHPLSTYEGLSERPAAMVRYLDENPDAKLAALWAALLPEGTPEPPKEWLVDLFWLLTQGHVLLFDDGKLVLPKRKQGGGAVKAAEPKAPKKKKRNKPSGPRKGRKAKFKSPAKALRTITRMSPGQVRLLKGQQRIWARRLARRERIESLLD